MPTTREFLEAILPQEGRKCAVVIDNGQPRQLFYETAAGLSEAVLRLDAGCSDRGAVYHGCAGYAPGGKRAKSAVVALQSFWLDIDCGAGRAYAGQAEALNALREFIARVDLPAPLLVASGVGLHCYWPLEQSLERAEWEPYALGLKALCELEGLAAGPERTADCASILRPPGTLHRKSTPRPVICGPLQGPYPIESFERLLRHAGNSRPASPPRRILDPSRRRKTDSALLAKLSNISAPEQIDFDALTRGCAQLRRLKETNGNVPEPLWYAGLGVLAHCVDGERVAHAWSAGHPTYSFTETARRLDRARLLSGPTSCDHFRSLGRETCAGCGNKGTTPLDAARERGPEPEVPLPEDYSAAALEGPPEPGDILAGHDYVIREGGVYLRAFGNEPKALDKDIYAKITSYAVIMLSVHAGEVRTEQAYYLLRHYKPHSGWHNVDVPAAKLFGQSMVAVLADLGIIVHDADLFRRYMRDSIDSIQKREKTKMQFEQFGWKEENTKFLYGDRLYTRDGHEAPACSPELRYRSQWLRPVPGGSVEGWKAAVDCLMGAGSEGMSFTVLASFGAVLMRFLEDNEGGAIISLMTRHSGAGKTTSLAGAYTVWAASDKGLGLTTIDTKVSKGATLGAMCNLPIVYDEFSNKDPEIVREFVLLFTSGRDKMRADASGQIMHSASSWQTILFTASNRSLVDTINSTGESEAPAFRVLEFPVESSGKLTLTEASRLKKQMEENAGWAGDAFLNFIVQKGIIDWVKKKLAELTDEIFEKGGFRKEHRYWVRALAATATAAIIVNFLGLVSFSPERIIGWAVRHFAALIQDARDRDSLLPWFARFLNDHVAETLTMPTAYKGKAMPPIGDKPRLRVSVRVDVDSGNIFVCQSTLRDWLARKGGAYSEMLREMKERGVLLNARRNITLTAGTELRSGLVPCVEIDGTHPSLTGIIREACGGTFQEKAEKIELQQRRERA